MQPAFSAGSDEGTLRESLSSLLTEAGGRWQLTSEGTGLERSFKFKTFAKTWVRLYVLFVLFFQSWKHAREPMYLPPPSFMRKNTKGKGKGKGRKFKNLLSNEKP